MMAFGHGQLLKPMDMANSHGPRQWPLAMANHGHGRWPWQLALAECHGHGQKPWPQAMTLMTNGHGRRPTVMTEGHDHWRCQKAMANGHGRKPWPWAMQHGHSRFYSKQADTVTHMLPQPGLHLGSLLPSNKVAVGDACSGDFPVAAQVIPPSLGNGLPQGGMSCSSKSSMSCWSRHRMSYCSRDGTSCSP